MDVTEDFIEAAFRGEPEAVAQLVTIHSDALDEPIRVTDWPGGLVSNGQIYLEYPFQLTWAAASQESPFGAAQITIANIDQRIEDASDAAENPPSVDIAIVKVSDPDIVERAVVGAVLKQVSGDDLKVTGQIHPWDFTREPACAVSYSPSTVPGLH